MGCPAFRIIVFFATSVISGQAWVCHVQAAPPLEAPPPLPQELLNNPPPEPPPDLPDPSELIAQLKQLQELMSMSPDKLAKLRQTIEFIEKMSESEREAMRIRLSQVTRMTDALRQEISRLAAIVPEIPRSDLSQFWLAESEEQREDLRTSMDELEPADKSALLTSKVNQFVSRRDRVFREMRDELEARKKALSQSRD